MKERSICMFVVFSLIATLLFGVRQVQADDSSPNSVTSVEEPEIVQVTGRLRRAQNPIPEEYLVTLKDLPKDQVDGLASNLAGLHGGKLQGVLKHGIKAFAVRMAEHQAVALSLHPMVEMVEENSQVFLSYTTQTFGADWPNFWHLDRIDNQGPLSDTLHAYAYTSTGSGVRAYVLDTGILAHHREFDLDGNSGTVGSRVEAGANMVTSWNDYSAANNPCPSYPDDYGVSHGTSVASILGGTYAGVAKGVKLIPVKVGVCPFTSTSNFMSTTTAIAWGLDWVLQDMQSRSGVRAVVNMSVYVRANQVDTLMCGNPAVNCAGAIENNIQNVIAAGIPVVVSANNQNTGTCLTSPARLGYGNEAAKPATHRTITVGATMYGARQANGTYPDARWICTGGNCGEDTGSNYGKCVSIYAPGHELHSAHTNGFSSYRSQLRSGTSFSAPVVAGMVARILQQYPYLTARQVWDDKR